MLEKFLRFLGVDLARVVREELAMDKGNALALVVVLGVMWLLFNDRSPFALGWDFP